MGSKPKKIKENRVIFDTSFQVERLKHGKDFVARNIGPKEEKRSLFFVLYEFKTGFLRSAFDYYCLVSVLASPADALAKWSDRFAPRELKNIMLIESVIKRISEKVFDNDKKTHLRKLEAAINFTISTFDTDLELMGDFSGDEIVRFEVFGESSYQAFIELHNSRKALPQKAFWERNRIHLDKFIESKKLFSDQKYEKMFDKLNSVKIDINKLDNINVNRGIGDAIISVDSPKGGTIVTTDKIYDLLCGILDKNKVRLIAKT